MHAPKNGFFYVLDAKTGKFISAKPFAKLITWAKGIDPVTGKPIVNPEARYEQTGKPYIGMPGAIGAHSWTPMSFSPKTGLVYIPANNVVQAYAAAGKDWKPTAPHGASSKPGTSPSSPLSATATRSHAEPMLCCKN